MIPTGPLIPEPMVGERGRDFDQLQVIPDKATDMGFPGQAALFQALRQFADVVVKRYGG